MTGKKSGRMSFPAKALRLYTEGFRNMPRYARWLWAIIIIKLLILFGIFRLFLMQNHLKSNFDSERERIEHVLDELTR